jgi:tripartite ATP-independent transporter DctP family solute receptor
MTLYRSLATLTAAGALVVGLGIAAADAQKTIRLSHLNPAGPTLSHSGAMAAVFKSLVEAGTNGSVQVQLFPDGQLGTDDEVIQQTRDGVIQSNISSAGGVAAHYPLVGVFDMPFAFPNIAVAHDVIDLENPFGQKLAEDIQAATGLRVIGLLDSGGFFAISNSRRPIQSVEDMEGLRIRTMTLPTHEAIISSLGGQPTPLPWPEVYTALQTGVADGQMNPIPIMAFARFDEVQGYLTLTNHIITPYVWFMNQDFYDGLTPEERNVVDWAARAATDAGRGISRIIEASDQGLPKLAEGMEVNALSAEERERFAEAAQPAVRDIIADRLGDEGVEMLDAMLAAIEASPYR